MAPPSRLGRTRAASFADSCIRKAMAGRGLTLDLVGLVDTGADRAPLNRRSLSALGITRAKRIASALPGSVVHECGGRYLPRGTEDRPGDRTGPGAATRQTAHEVDHRRLELQNPPDRWV